MDAAPDPKRVADAIRTRLAAWRPPIEAARSAEAEALAHPTVGAVRVWKHRDRFPREAWLELSQAFPELTLEVLKGIEPAKTERAA